MGLFEGETELSGEEVVANEGHQQDEVVDDGLHILHLEFLHALRELACKIFPQHVDDDILELGFPVLAGIGRGSLILRHCYESKGVFQGIFPDQAHVGNGQRQGQQDDICIGRINAVGSGLSKYLIFLGLPQKIHDLVLALSWHGATREENLEVFPLVFHELLHLLFKVNAEVCEELSSW